MMIFGVRDQYRPSPSGKILCHLEDGTGTLLLPATQICFDIYNVPAVRAAFNMSRLDDENELFRFSHLYLEQDENFRVYTGIRAVDGVGWRGTGILGVQIESKNERIERLTRELASKTRLVEIMGPPFFESVAVVVEEGAVDPDTRKRLVALLEDNLSKRKHVVRSGVAPIVQEVTKRDYVVSPGGREVVR